MATPRDPAVPRMPSENGAIRLVWAVVGAVIIGLLTTLGGILIGSTLSLGDKLDSHLAAPGHAVSMQRQELIFGLVHELRTDIRSIQATQQKQSSELVEIKTLLRDVKKGIGE